MNTEEQVATAEADPTGDDTTAEGEPRHTRAISALAAAAEAFQADGSLFVVAQRWPGSRNTVVELLLIGHSGVFLFAATQWGTVTLNNGAVQAESDTLVRSARALNNAIGQLERALASTGLAPGEIIPVAVTEQDRVGEPRHGWYGRIRVIDPHGIDSLVDSRGHRLSSEQVIAIGEALLPIFDEQLAPQLERLRAALPRDEDGDPIPEQLDVLNWMTELNPEQIAVVTRDFSGPARLRGAAGTGKTVVGMHRAAQLALSATEPVMVTSLVRTLPKVMERQFAMLAPELVDRVDFTSVHRVALDVLSHRGVKVTVDLGAAALAFRGAWDSVGADGDLARQPVPATYWQEEIDHVIKGRGISKVDDYLMLDRTGRRFEVKTQLRMQVWELLSAYSAELAKRGVQDLGDMMSMAEAELAREPWHKPYSAVIVDEAQDLSPVAIRMLHHLVGDKPNGLLLIADGQQGITPGSFMLSEAGVDVSGRDILLQTNMRSDRSVGLAAHAVVAGHIFDDLDGVSWHPQRGLEWSRGDGRLPNMVAARNLHTHDAALVSWVDAISKFAAGGPVDVAILAGRYAQVGHYRKLLLNRGYEVVDLDGYDGTPSKAIKIGTMRRAKGLTFAHVALPQLRGTSLYDTALSEPQEMDAATIERAERERREVFSAMGRAREDLWMGYLKPSNRRYPAH